MTRRIGLAALVFAGTCACIAESAQAEDSYKIGASVGLTGYAATAARLRVAASVFGN